MRLLRAPFLRLLLGLSVPGAALAQNAAVVPAPAGPAAPAAAPAATPAKPEELHYDEIVVKGVKLQGHIVSFNEKTLTFETIYGKGQLEVSFDDLEQLRT